MALTRKEKYFAQSGIRTHDLRILIAVAPRTDREQAVGVKRKALSRDNLKGRCHAILSQLRMLKYGNSKMGMKFVY